MFQFELRDALYAAAQEGHLDVVKYLVENCGQLNKVGSDMSHLDRLLCRYLVVLFSKHCRKDNTTNYNTSVRLCGFFLCFSANIINVST